MNIQKLSSISLGKDKDVQWLLRLPKPDEKELSRAKAPELLEMSSIFFALWMETLSDQIAISDELIAEFGKEEKIWSQLVFSLGRYYDLVCSQFLQRSSTQERESKRSYEFPLGINLQSLNNLMEIDITERDSYKKWARGLTIEYFLFRISAYMIDGLLGSLALPDNTLGLLLTIQGILKGIYDCAHQKEDTQETRLADLLLGSALRYLEKIAEHESERKKPETYQKGVFLKIKPTDLPRLASRDNSLLKNYGQKEIEKLFEQQLALIFQSFGLFVVPTQTGQRTIDLVCISADPLERITFLVEAKTSSHHYSLPAKDSRAIEEYVTNVQKSLLTLPPLRFVLVVGPEPAQTIAAKIAQLENKIGIPVRYCTAQEIAKLRENLTGQIPVGIFSKHILNSPPIIEQGFSETVLERYTQQQNAHLSFVENLLAANEIITKKRNLSEGKKS